jgi:uncharacterized membrane protein YfcA
MIPDETISLLATGSGAIVGLVLGLVGGGGSILAVPLLVYLVGVSPPHLAIGTSALAVSAGGVMWGMGLWGVLLLILLILGIAALSRYVFWRR